MSIVTILSILVSSMIVYAAPLIFTSIGGAYSEHAGVVNVGLEGIMAVSYTHLDVYKRQGQDGRDVWQL